MKTSLILSCLILAVSSTVARSADSVSAMCVESSRVMKVAIINGDRHNPANEQLNQAFAESLGFEISQRCNMPVPVKPLVRDARDAAAGLANGTYDLVLVIGESVPGELLSSDFKGYRAMPVSGNRKQMINLVMSQDDPGLEKVLVQSFPSALRGVFFQKALVRYSGSSAESEKPEWKVAVASLE